MPGSVPEFGTSREPPAGATLDVRGLLCPLPILKAKKVLSGLSVGGVLEVLSTDPASVADFEAFCRATGHELLAAGSSGDVKRFLIRRR